MSSTIPITAGRALRRSAAQPDYAYAWTEGAAERVFVPAHSCFAQVLGAWCWQGEPRRVRLLLDKGGIVDLPPTQCIRAPEPAEPEAVPVLLVAGPTPQPRASWWRRLVGWRA